MKGFHLIHSNDKNAKKREYFRCNKSIVDFNTNANVYCTFIFRKDSVPNDMSYLCTFPAQKIEKESKIDCCNIIYVTAIHIQTYTLGVQIYNL